MAQVKVFYEPDTELLTLFWQTPRQNQICTELGNGVILIKDRDTEDHIGLEFLVYKPGDSRLLNMDIELSEKFLPNSYLRDLLHQTIDDLIRSSHQMNDFDFEFHRSSSDAMLESTLLPNLVKS